MTIDEIISALQDRKLTVVADKTSLHYNTLRAIASGENRNPSYETYAALVEYLKENK